MSKNIKLKKGFNINLAGKAEKIVADYSAETFAVKPTDFLGFIKPKVLVEVGDKVKAGTPLYYDKSAEAVKFASPVSGEVIAVNRGAKRRLLEIVVKSDGALDSVELSKKTISEIASASAEDLKTQICESGAWGNIVQRPYGTVANPSDSPKSIFISGFDSNPLAADYGVILKGKEEAFKAGIEVLKKLTAGKVHLSTKFGNEVVSAFANLEGVEQSQFDGPHPSGNVGVQIHHLDPINKGDLVWTIDPVAVAQIGNVFIKGQYDASRVIAVAGSELNEAKYYNTFTGANVKELTNGNLKSDNVRIVSGSVLSGEKVEKDGFVGFYDNNFSIIPEGDDLIFFGSFKPDASRLSFQKAFGLLSFLNGSKKEYVLNSNINGEKRAFVQSGVMEKVLPMDIYPIYLLKAILTEDYDSMEALGIYEVVEEDFALCEFVDVSKNDVQKIIRQGLDLMQNS